MSLLNYITLSESAAPPFLSLWESRGKGNVFEENEDGRDLLLSSSIQHSA